MEAGTSTASAKQALRTQLTARRRALSPGDLADAREAVRRHVLVRLGAAELAGTPWRRIFAYESMPTEPGSDELLGALADRGASIFVPLLREDKDLDWIRWPDSTSLGLGAVAGASVLLVPALAVDRSGMRLGRGGGSYDRALQRVGSDVPVVALLHRGELLAEVPAESWDRRVTAAVTPDGWYDLPA